jgi:hypothetical protein
VSPHVRAGLAFLILSPLVLSFAVGRGAGDRIINTMPVDRFVDVKILREYGSESFSKKHILEGQDKLLYLGVANDYVFFLSPDKSKTYVFKFSDLHFLELKTK